MGGSETVCRAQGYPEEWAVPQVDSAAFITQLIGFIVTYYGLYAVLVGLVLPKMQWHLAIRRHAQ